MKWKFGNTGSIFAQKHEIAFKTMKFEIKTLWNHETKKARNDETKQLSLFQLQLLELSIIFQHFVPAVSAHLFLLGYYRHRAIIIQLCWPIFVSQCWDHWVGLTAGGVVWIWWDLPPRTHPHFKSASFQSCFYEIRLINSEAGGIYNVGMRGCVGREPPTQSPTPPWKPPPFSPARSWYFELRTYYESTETTRTEGHYR